MVNRSRSRNMRRGRRMRRSRRMRGGVGPVVETVVEGVGSGEGVGSVVEGYPSAKRQRMDDGTKPGVDESKQVEGDSSWYNSIPGADFLTDAKGEGSEVISSATGALSSATSALSGLFSSEETPAAVETNDGKRMRMKGGRGLGLDYYATSVNGIKVAQPTYMEYYKGGKRRTKRSRRRSKRSRTCKRRRSCKR